MFTINNEKTKKPIKVWLQNLEDVEESCLEQAYNLSQLPFIHNAVALMPDTHTGKGMPIGGVIATDGVIIPNAVGVDIGCGMAFVSTNIKVEDIKDIVTGNGTIIQAMIGSILRNVPVGVNKHRQKRECKVADKAFKEMDKYKDYPELVKEFDLGYYQVGTLGGGNHFIELQEDEDGYLGIMIHSGSRHLGKTICDTFHEIARDMNEKYYSNIPEGSRLNFLPVDSKEGQDYINFMNLALEFAYENREMMMVAVKQVVEEFINKFTDIKVEYNTEINCHHNYAALENHFGKNVWVHRKGATRARLGELAVIPGAMGSYSYVVEGLGNEESFCTSSHGAGRCYSRSGAKKEFSVEKVMLDLKEQGVILGKNKKGDIAEECRFAYKNIDEFMENQKDLVKAVKKLKTLGVVKG